jgi:hypothetical protein
MLKAKKLVQATALFLTLSILFTACDVPDISEFTTTSSEMTRAIRKGFSETSALLNSASKNELFDDTIKDEFSAKHKDFNKASKPTIKVLEGIDSYLEALNALAASNKKSGENAKAVVDSVGSLVSLVTGSALPSVVGKASTWLITEFNKFQTFQSFEDRVKSVSVIMEGQTDSSGKKKCTDEKLAGIENSTTLSDAEKARLFNGLGCGVIDILKQNLRDLQGINNNVSETLHTRTFAKNKITIDYNNSLNTNDLRIQKELSNILIYKDLYAKLNELQRAVNLEFDLFKANLENTYRRKIQAAPNNTEKERLRREKEQKIRQRQSEINRESDKAAEYRSEIKSTLELIISLDQTLSALQNETDSLIIITRLEAREKELLDKTKLYTADLQRISPAYSRATAELEQIRTKQKQLNELLETGIDALDAWADTHANLRISLKTKKTLTVSRLLSKVREMWEILKPSEEN